MLPSVAVIALCGLLSRGLAPSERSTNRATASSDRAPHETAQMPGMDTQKHSANEDESRWMLMSDGAFTLMLNGQGGARGETEARAPNWWMGMASHRLGPGRFTGQVMVSLDPATVGKCGYGELFQVGETCNGRPLADRQHPHDLTSQLAAVWRIPINDQTAIVFAGGPVGEPAIGPVAFMHRPSAGANPVAPLSHHTFDSTHVAMGVATAAIDRGAFAVEASVFNGREPNENRWNVVDRGPWDSWSARAWYLPSPQWQVQISTGHLVAPEALEPGNIQRTTGSVSWFRSDSTGYSAVTGGYGRNDKSHDRLNAMFVEGCRHSGRNEVYGRFEAKQVETDILAAGTIPDLRHTLPNEVVLAGTGGAFRDLTRLGNLELGVGADLTFYRVPPDLVASHGRHPVSFHVFLSLRPRTIGRMWNMTMTGLLMSHREMASMPGM